MYGARKVWEQFNREWIAAGRWTVVRLMKQLGIAGFRLRRMVRKTVSQPQDERPRDLVDRQFVASHPNQLWVTDITYIATWRGVGFMAFVTDVYSLYIVGWRALKTMKTDLVLDALEQAIWARGKTKGVIHHGDQQSQYVSIRYSERLIEEGFKASLGSVGDS